MLRWLKHTSKPVLSVETFFSSREPAVWNKPYVEIIDLCENM